MESGGVGVLWLAEWPCLAGFALPFMGAVLKPPFVHNYLPVFWVVLGAVQQKSRPGICQSVHSGSIVLLA